VFLALEIAHAFGAYDALGPLACYEVVKESQVQGAAAVEYPCGDAVFLAVCMVVVMVVSAAAVFAVVVMVVTLAVFVVMVVFFLILLVVVVMVVFFLMLLVVMVFFQFFNPLGAGGDFLKVKYIGVQYLIEFYVAVVAGDNLGLWL
jgi:uncharacterized Tic20 family protein